MKNLLRLTIIMAIVFSLLGNVEAGRKARKLPVDAYIKAAKIEIISGDMERYELAKALLDSLFLYYGPNAEGLHLMGQMAVDGIESNASPADKAPYVDLMVAYFDSLHLCCENPDIDKKHKKHCDDFTEQSDSVKVKYWREFYNAGIEQLNAYDDMASQLEEATDSSVITYLENTANSNLDSSFQNLNLAMIIEPTDNRAFIAMGSAYTKQGNHDEAIEWKKKGLARAVDSTQLLLSIAYDYINMGDYAASIPFMQDYTRLVPDDTVNMYNLSICYKNSQMYDSAKSIYGRLLELDPDNIEVLSDMGRYFNEMGRRASDSAKIYETAGDSAMQKLWMAERSDMFDSSQTYFGHAFEVNPDDEFIVETYGMVCAIDGKYDKAAVAFKRLSELQPTNVDNWVSLGDVYLSMRQFDSSIVAYEKVVELRPTNVKIWEQLADLYHEMGQSAKEKEAQQKVKSLK